MRRGGSIPKGGKGGTCISGEAGGGVEGEKREKNVHRLTGERGRLADKKKKGGNESLGIEIEKKGGEKGSGFEPLANEKRGRECKSS